MEAAIHILRYFCLYKVMQNNADKDGGGDGAVAAMRGSCGSSMASRASAISERRVAMM